MNDEVDRLITMYDGGHLNRRQLLQELVGIGFGMNMLGARSGLPVTGEQQTPLFRAHTINHVTIHATDVAQSKAFYQTITGLPIRAEDKDFCEFRLEHGFLGLYKVEAGQRAGYDHFCLGVEKFNALRALAALKSAVPAAQPTLEFDDQIYLRDPDGVRVQLADVKYKR